MSGVEAERGRKRIAEHCREAGLSTKRFIDVVDGTKKSHNHTQVMPDSAALTGNYGIYAGPGADGTGDVWLVDIDVDDYNPDADTAALDDLPATLTVETPHTDGETGGHRFYGVTGDIVAAMKDVADASNPSPSWGEVRVVNQYVVGPGSQIEKGEEGCDKEWCQQCAKPDGGYYRIAHDTEIATIDADTLADVVRSDPKYADTADGDGDGDENDSASLGDYEPNDTDGTAAETVASENRWIAEYLALGADDRSKKDTAVCRTMIEHGVSEADARNLLESSTKTKVAERGRDYWTSTWCDARENATPHAATADGGTVTTEAGEDDSDGDDTPHEFVERGGEYGVFKSIGEGEDERQVFDQWTNFTIEAVEFLRERGDGDVRATLCVSPATDEDDYEVTVPMTVFNDSRTFRSEVVVGRTTTFEAGGSALNALRRFVGGQDAPTRLAVDQVGLFGYRDERTEFVTPEGSIAADGWADDPAYTWDAPENAVSESWGVANDTDGGDWVPDREAVADALRLVPQTRLADRFLPVMGWFYAAPLRPYVMDWVGEAPQLSVTGDTEAGKTATLEHLSRLFGGSGEVLSASASYFSLMMDFAASNAFPVVIDEYKPADMPDSKVDAFKEYLRKSTRGASETRGRKDMGVDSYPLNSPVAVAGEQAVSGPAQERRLISVNFSKRATERNTDTHEAFARLAGLTYEREDGTVEHFPGVDLSEHALAYYRFVAGLDDDELHQAWRRSGKRVRDVRTDLGGVAEDVKNAKSHALQTVAFGLGTYRAFAAEYGVDASAEPVGVTDEAIASALRYLMTHGRDPDDHRARRSSHIDLLLSVMARAADAGYLDEGKHFAFINEGEPDEQIGIKLSTAFDAVRRYARDYDVADADLLDSVNDYRSRLRDAVDQDKSVVIDTSKQVYGIGTSGVVFHIGRAMATVPDFDRDMFGDRFDDRIPNEYVAGGVEPDHMAEAVEAADEAVEAANTQAERVERIREALRTLADRTATDGVERDEIVEYAADKYGIERDKTHQHLNRFLRSGKIYETDKGRLRHI